MEDGAITDSLDKEAPNNLDPHRSCKCISISSEAQGNG